MSMKGNIDKSKGIYLIHNIKSGKIYVGSAKDIKHRFSSHESNLRRNKHPNNYLQNSYNKNGEQSFEIHVLERTNNLLEREQYWIDTLKADYNINKNASRNPNTERKKETRDKISKALKGKPKSEEHRRNLCKPKAKNSYPKCPIPNNLGYSRMSVAVKQYTLDEVFIKEYPSVSDASRRTGINPSGINKAITLENRTAGKFKWKKSNVEQI